MLAADSARPAILYRYDRRDSLERALTLGEFRLQPLALPMSMATAGQPGGAYLGLQLTQQWDEMRLDAARGLDACLVIHDAEQFGERLHRAAQQALPNWAGIDAAVSYGTPSPLGAAFSQARQFAFEQAWLFAWRPMQPVAAVHPIVISIGNLEAIAQLRGKSH